MGGKENEGKMEEEKERRRKLWKEKEGREEESLCGEAKMMINVCLFFLSDRNQDQKTFACFGVEGGNYFFFFFFFFFFWSI